jgi:hypothetical protein
MAGTHKNPPPLVSPKIAKPGTIKWPATPKGRPK